MNKKVALYVGMFVVSVVWGYICNTASVVWPAIGAATLGVTIAIGWGEKDIYWPFIISNLAGFLSASVFYDAVTLGNVGVGDLPFRLITVGGAFFVGFIVAVGILLALEAPRQGSGQMG